MPGAGSEMWPCRRKHKTSSRVMVWFGFVQTVTKGQLYLGKLSAGSGIVCCSSSSITPAKGGGHPVACALVSLTEMSLYSGASSGLRVLSDVSTQGWSEELGVAGCPLKWGEILREVRLRPSEQSSWAVVSSFIGGKF